MERLRRWSCTVTTLAVTPLLPRDDVSRACIPGTLPMRSWKNETLGAKGLTWYFGVILYLNLDNAETFVSGSWKKKLDN